MSPTTSPSLSTRKSPGLGHLADHRGAGLPALAERDHLAHPRRLDHRQHPLLRLGDHDLEGLHVRLAQRHPADVDVDPDLALGCHLARRGGEPGGAEVLKRDEQAPVEQLEAALEQLRLLERVADLHGRALLVARLELGGGEHRGAADPVAAGRGPHQHDRVAGAGRRRADRRVGASEADAHRVDEAVLLVGAPRSRPRRRPWARRSSCRSGRCRRRRGRRDSASARSRARRSEASRGSRSAGAPSANTSRRIPPTPVAAPWKGSTALGWLWDSTLKATAQPSPIETAPAFSPGPISTRSPSVGSRPSSLRECL